MSLQPSRQRWGAVVALTAMLTGQIGAPLVAAAQNGKEDKRDAHSRKGKRVRTETPIKHVIVLIGENRTFDVIAR